MNIYLQKVLVGQLPSGQLPFDMQCVNIYLQKVLVGQFPSGQLPSDMQLCEYLSSESFRRTVTLRAVTLRYAMCEYLS